MVQRFDGQRVHYSEWSVLAPGSELGVEPGAGAVVPTEVSGAEAPGDVSIEAAPAGAGEGGMLA
jgi:hypothetical protein